MKDAVKPYSIIKLHNRDEHCWGVVDGKGALVAMDGLSMKLTKAEARSYADEWNEQKPDDRSMLTEPPA